ERRIAMKDELVGSGASATTTTSPFLRSKKIGFIGAGNMTKAVASSLVETNTINANKLFISSRTQDKVKKLADNLGIVECSSSDDVIEKSDIVVLAVKPQDLGLLLDDIGKSFEEHQLVISFAAGYDNKWLRQHIPRADSIVRVMPSTAAKIQR